MSGAAELGHPPRKAEKLFDLMPSSRATGSTNRTRGLRLPGLPDGYLKAHYAVEFMAALLTSETGNTAKVVKYINECRDLASRFCRPT